ncbi:MAG: radical SAM protein [Bacteroidota bacterium]
MPQEVHVKSILNKKKLRDPWFLDDYTINPYSGCSFNCLYCYIRGSRYGTHMEEKLSVKANALGLLEKQLSSRAKKGQHGIIVLSSATEPYLQFEKDYRLTRGILELILKHRFPVHVITRSDLVTRDLDLLSEIDKSAILPAGLPGRDPELQRGAFVSFSFSFLDDKLGKIFEPGATPPSLRLETLQKVAGSGLHTGVSLMPLLPWISDTAEHLELMYSSFKQAAGAKYIFPATLTLFGEGPSDSRTLVLKAVEKHFPHLSEKYQKFFGSGQTQLPPYYQKAFYTHMAHLQAKYGIRNSIF